VDVVASGPTLTTSHTIVLTGLVRRTTYDDRVTSTDAAGNATTSAITTFTTTK